MKNLEDSLVIPIIIIYLNPKTLLVYLDLISFQPVEHNHVSINKQNQPQPSTHAHIDFLESF